MALGRFWLVIAATLAACARAAPEPAPPHAAGAIASSPASATPESVAASDSCAPLADLGEIVAASPGPPNPEIVDGDAGMAHFYARLAEFVRGRAADHVRVAVYGDSNMTTDFITGELRRLFQKRFGDGGHGFVDLAGHMFYRPIDIERGDDGAFTAFTLVNNPAPDGMYGFGMMAAESRRKGAATWVSTSGGAAPIGRTASRFDVYYLKGPRFGSFEAAIDGARAASVDTRADKAEVGLERLSAADGPHKLTITATTTAPVRLFGVAVERAAPSVIVDSLGVVSADVKHMAEKNDAAIWAAALAKRSYDLVVFLTGTNEFFGKEQHSAIMKRLVDLHRRALPRASILIVAPPDRVDGPSPPPGGGPGHAAAHTTWTLAETAREKKEIAAENRCAFWDLREAMGGDASALDFVRTRRMESDKRHFTKEGGFWVGDRLAFAIWRGFVAWTMRHEGAGCDAR